MACARPLAAAAASWLAPCPLPSQQPRSLLRPRRPAGRFTVAFQRRRGPLRCRAHAGEHHHAHEAAASSGEHSHEHSHGGCGGVGHDHHHEPNASNPAHRVLKAVYDTTNLTPAAEWLESSLPSSAAKIGLFLLAATAAGWGASGWAASAAQAQLARTVSAAATIGVYLFAGLPAAVNLSYDLTEGKVDTHVLMNLAVLGTLATGHALEGALLLVLFQTSHVVEHKLTDRAQGNLAALYDTIPKAAVVVDLAPDGSPDMGSARRVLAAKVAVGDCLLVKPGEQVPLDGEIVHGRAMVSSEHITGESLPVLMRAGNEVAAGSLNRDGILVVRALRPSEESTPARIAKLALDAQAKRPQLRTWLDEFGEVYSKGVIAATVGLLAVLLLAGVPLLGAAGQRGAFYRAMGLLTVASPCALVMVPLAYVSAIAAIASRGILVKGGRVLDALAGCSTIAFDKTGTLTTGSLACTSMRPLCAAASSSGGRGGGSSSSSILGVGPREAAAAKRAALAAAVALSLRSSHPVSDAVVLHGQQAGLDGGSEGVSDFELVPGGGVQGLVSSKSSSRSGGSSSGGGGSSTQQQHASFGSLEFVSSLLSAAEVEAVEKLAAAQGSSSTLSVLVLAPASSSNNGSCSGSSSSGRSVWVMSFEDSLRKQSLTAVRALQTGSWTGSASQADRMSVTMLTGDNDASAQRIARKLGITSVQSSLSPEQKLEYIQQLSTRSDSSSGSSGSGKARKSGSSRRGSGSGSGGGSGGGKGGVIMVGDGINDAPALAAANVGVAISSTATAAASLAADVIVVNSSGIAALPLLLNIAKATQAIIRQNLILAAGSILALALPTMLGWVPLWVAVMLHEGSTLLVALNSLRLLGYGAPRRSGGGSGQQQGQQEALGAAGGGGGSGRKARHARAQAVGEAAVDHGDASAASAAAAAPQLSAVPPAA